MEALHTLIDAVTVLLSLISAMVASKPATSRFTYGFGRAEILSAFISLVALVLLCLKLGVRAATRIIDYVRGQEVEVVSGRVVVLAEAVTLVANVLSAVVLSGNGASLNVRAVRAHVIADSIENIFVLLAGIVMWMVPAWGILDPLLTIFVILLLVVLNWGISVETVELIMQSAPRGMVQEVCNRIEQLYPDVFIDQPHIWTVTTDVVVGSVKVFVPDGADAYYMEQVRDEVSKVMNEAGVHQTCVEVRTGQSEQFKEEYSPPSPDTTTLPNQQPSTLFSIGGAEEYNRLPSRDLVASEV